MGSNRDIYCYANREVVNFEREYQLLPLGTRILVMSQFSYMPDQILGKKNTKKLNFQAKFHLSLGSSARKICKDVFNNFYMANCLWL